LIRVAGLLLSQFAWDQASGDEMDEPCLPKEAKLHGNLPSAGKISAI